MQTGKKKAINIILCCILGIPAELFSSSALGLILNAIPGAAEKYSSDMSALFDNDVRIILLVVLVMPVIEELIFRLLIMGVSLKFMNFIAANILQALFFGVYHGNVIQGIYAFLLGLFVGELKNMTQTIFACIGFHCFFNATGLLLDDFMPADLSVAWTALIMTASLAGLVIIFRRLWLSRCDLQTS